MKFGANEKKYVTGIALVLLSAVNITAPVNLRGMIPSNILNYITWIAYIGLLGAWWIFNSETA